MSNANGRKTLDEAKAGIHGEVATALALCLEIAAKDRDNIRQQRAELLEALKVAKDALEHMWREVSMNEYDYEKLNEAIINSYSAITKVEAAE